MDKDGAVTFSDLPEDVLEILHSLESDEMVACEVKEDKMSGDYFEVRPVIYESGEVVLLDQRRLPSEEVYLRLARAEDVAQAIKHMVVRGAPAIGIAAAMGLSAEMANVTEADWVEAFGKAAKTLREARPTAVNLSWAVSRMEKVFETEKAKGLQAVRKALEAEALRILEEDIEMNRHIGKHGAELIPDGATIMTHCNAGALATGGYGTALGVVRAAREAGKRLRVIACETRPYLQGARLTAWELVREGFDVTVITDNAAGYLMAKGLIHCIIVGADRIAANGDVANKIGTYTHAVLAKRHNIPFYVAAPSSTLDLTLADGSAIPIEERPAEEVTHLAGQRVAAPGVRVINPAFDVTPWPLITAIITERGVHKPGPNGYTFD